MIASGIGTLVIGLLTTIAEFSGGLGTFLNWWNPTGALSGKTGVGILAWLISWIVLNNLWKDKEYDLQKAFKTTLILIGLGLLLTFPPFFVLFAAE